jgi:uncharacterized protein YqcC (DUF446 family)
MSMELVAGKIEQVKMEMVETGVWKQQVPAWVNEYHEDCNDIKNNFTEWLQFVYLPNLLSTEAKPSSVEKQLIVPQALRFFGDDVKKGKLLQLLIELDALV